MPAIRLPPRFPKTVKRKPRRKSEVVEAMKPEPSAAPAGKERMKVSAVAKARARQQQQNREEATRRVFNPAEPPPGVLPKDVEFATDEQISEAAVWGAQSLYNGAFTQGYTFLGYAYLAELAQVPEYRRAVEVIATEMTRKWIKIQSAKDEEKKKNQVAATVIEAVAGEAGKELLDQTAKIKELTEEFERLNVRECFREVAEIDGFFGRAHIYLDTGATDNREELKTDLGNGKNGVSKSKMRRGKLQKLKTIEPVWTYPSAYNANDPLTDEWYDPKMWFVMGKELHVSRLLPFVGREVPDMLKPTYSFGGLSLTQMMKPYVDNWLQTRSSVGALIQAFSVMVLKTNLMTSLAGDGQEGDCDQTRPSGATTRQLKTSASIVY